MASMMRKEHQRAEELEQRKEVERWEQSQQYQDQLERQLMEQVSLRPRSVSDPVRTSRLRALSVKGFVAVLQHVIY